MHRQLKSFCLYQSTPKLINGVKLYFHYFIQTGFLFSSCGEKIENITTAAVE